MAVLKPPSRVLNCLKHFRSGQQLLRLLQSFQIQTTSYIYLLDWIQSHFGINSALFRSKTNMIITQSLALSITTLLSLYLFSLTSVTFAQGEPTDHVTCGSVLKLDNEAKPKFRLHSHDIKYGSGSGQQSVTAVENQDTNSYWAVMGEKDKHCNRGEPIECGATIRLKHIQTSHWLHSHLFKSPLSGQQEVSAFGSDDESDTGDHWTVYCKSKYWKKGDPVRFKHIDTSTWLSLSGNIYGRPIFGQLEVICSTSSDSSSYWRAVEGVYVQPTVKFGSAEHEDQAREEL